LAQAFDLPESLEARRPPEARGIPRDGVSLLVSSARAGTHTLARFTDIAKYLRAGDLLVANDSATIPAALEARRRNGTVLHLHLSTRVSEQLWIVEPRRTPVVQVGERLALPQGGSIELIAPLHRAHRRLWYAVLALPCPVEKYLAAYGRPISYDYVEGTYPIEAYQTIFAREPGSVEMPSAGRPFTLRIIDDLYRHNVNVAAITLHCGVASPEAHEPPLDERFAVPDWTAQSVNATRAAGGRVIAVGTTVVRALESAASPDGTVRAARGWTSHIVDAQHPPRAVDGLLTGFHEPRASHLLMLEAFTSQLFLDAAYRTALSSGMLWHEFGDVHLIVP
jgi:S-adenosylmethionine:tRNA ribosyltransferase-isomerase